MLMAAVPQITLYTKPECHLCAEALEALERLRRRYPHELHAVDITAEPALLERYRDRIPVLAVGGREYSAPLTPSVLRRALEQAR
jgi:glutaredoxin